MPTINIYHDDTTTINTVAIEKIKEFTAAALTCGDITLTPNDMSVRLVKADMQGAIASIECDIAAYNFPERSAKQDAICADIRGFMIGLWGSKDVRVRLQLCELGHSM